MNDMIGFTCKIDKNNRITIPQGVRRILKINPGNTLYLLCDIKKSEVDKETLGKIVYQCSKCLNIFDKELFERYMGECPHCSNRIIEMNV